MESLSNNLLQAIKEPNESEAIYWARYLKNHLLQQHSIKDSNFALPLTEIFEGFAISTGPELSALLASIAWESIKHEDFPVIMQIYTNEIVNGLDYSQMDSEVVKLCLKVVFELGFQNGHFTITNNQCTTNLPSLALKPLLAPNYAISSCIVEHLKALPTEILKVHFIAPLLELYSQSRSDAVVQFRFLELFHLIKHDQEEIMFTFFNDLKTIISSTNDALLSISGLQTILDCIKSKAEFDLFCKYDLINLLINHLSSSSSSNLHKNKIMDIFSETALLKCFDSSFIEGSGIDRLVSQLLQEDNCTASALYCACALASIRRGDLLSNFHNFLFHGNSSSIQHAALHGLGVYFSSSSSESDCSLLLNQILAYDKNFFIWLEEKTRSTFEDQKSAAFFALKSILSVPNGLKLALNHSSLLGNLLQRDLDDSLIGLKWKFGILEQIANSSQLRACLSDAMLAQVNEYLRNGVVFSKMTTRVAFESA